ncbi:hypothetical protein DFH29DRAFT_589765 [Suillus ampliporus]|nr:hypothetical protein DFH29DRAFT_589765 [Suillus ampliporus]
MTDSMSDPPPDTYRAGEIIVSESSAAYLQPLRIFRTVIGKIADTTLGFSSSASKRHRDVLDGLMQQFWDQLVRDVGICVHRTVSFSSDGTRIMSGSSDKTVRLWDAAMGQPVGGPFQGHTDSVNSASFSPDGTRFVPG